MKPKRLALLLSLFLGLSLSAAGPAHAESIQLTAGTSAEQFALMGGVFLILGGTFVFAPQIVSAVNGFMAAVFRRPRKAPKTAENAAEASQSPTIHVLDVPETQQQIQSYPQAPEYHEHSSWEPVHQPEEGQRSDVVSRLRDEISSSWSSPHGE